MNHLKNEKSPYLLQHRENPVDWFPWGNEAFEKAKKEEKPVFLSIGYSTCHWCHVMAHESFEDKEIAQILNESFVPGQGRPGRTSGYRCCLHGGLSGDDRFGRMADDRFANPG